MKKNNSVWDNSPILPDFITCEMESSWGVSPQITLVYALTPKVIRFFIDWHLSGVSKNGRTGKIKVKGAECVRLSHTFDTLKVVIVAESVEEK